MPKTSIRKAEPLSCHCSFNVGGPADYFAAPKDPSDLIASIEFAEERGLKYFILGAGTNILFDDAGYCGMVIAFAMPQLMSLVDDAAKKSLTGLEFAAGIPGSLGGALYMNAGAHGREMADVVEACEVYDIEKKELRTLAANELNFGYRDSIFQHEKLIALSAKFNLIEGDKAEISAKVSKYLGERKTKQPLDFPSAGSFFKRPAGAFAGRLIEEAGLKGAAVGGAKVSEKHAGFIINAGGATSADIVKLKELIVERVYANSGIALEPEVRIIAP